MSEKQEAFYDHREDCVTCEKSFMSDELCPIGLALLAKLSEEQEG